MKKQLTSLLLFVAALCIFITACKKNEATAPVTTQLTADAAARSYNANVRGVLTAKATAEVPLTWYKLSFSIFSTAPFQPAGPISARTYAYLGLALYESVVPGMPRYQSIQSGLNGLPVLPQVDINQKYYYPACANAALASVLRQMLVNASPEGQNRIDSLENVFVTQFKSSVPQDVLDRSVQFGKAIGNAVYDWSTSDGGASAYLNPFPQDYVPPTGPGLWTPLPGQGAFLPNWGDVRPFIASNVAGTQPPPLPPFSTKSGSVMYKEEMALYQKSKNLTTEQQAIALYWNTGPGSFSSIAIVNNILASQSASLATAAEAYCKAGIAIHDANITCFKTKYTYNQERPITYIRAHIDSTWSPYLVTPPIPDYTNAIPCQAAANARALVSIFGNRTTFTNEYVNSLGFTPITYQSFTEHVADVALSCYYGGVSIPSSNAAGVYQGNQVGVNVNALQFKRM